MSSREKGDVTTISILGASATVLAVGSEQSWEETRNSPSIKSSSKGDSAMQSDATIVDVEGTLESLYVHSDSAQERLIDLSGSNTKVTLVKERSDATFASASAVITNLTLRFAHNENATFSASFDLDGDWVEA